MGTRSSLTYFLIGDKLDKIEPLKIILSPCLVKISYGDKIKILKIFLSPCLANFLMRTRSPLTYFLYGDKTKILKIILSPCLVNISDGDKISIDIFFEWGQDWIFENYLVPILSKNFLLGQDENFKNYLVPMLSKFSDGDKIPSTYFLNGDNIEP